MIEDQVTILLLIAIGGSGTAAGYFTRVVQKYEERQDAIHLTKLPALFSSLFNFVQLSREFRDGGSVDEFADRLDKLVDNLKSEIFTGEIILFEKKIYDELANIYPHLYSLNALAKKVKENKNNNAEQVFRLSFKNDQEFENMKPSEIVTSAEKITDSIRTRFKQYKSISVVLLIAVFVLGAAVAAIEYFKSTT